MYLIPVLYIILLKCRLICPKVVSNAIDPQSFQLIFDWVQNITELYAACPYCSILVFDKNNILGTEPLFNDVPIIIFNHDHAYIETHQMHYGALVVLEEKGMPKIKENLDKYYKISDYVNEVPLILVLINGTFSDVNSTFKQCNISKIYFTIIATWTSQILEWYTWNKKTNSIIHQTGNFDVLKNLHKSFTLDAIGYDLKICVFRYYPNIMFFKNGTSIIPSGIDGLLLTNLMQHMKANYELIMMNNTGEETLASRQNLKKGVCELVFVALASTPGDSTVVNFYPLFSESLCLMVPKAARQSIVWNLIKPFKDTTWMYLGIAMLVLLMSWLVFFNMHFNSFKETEKLLNVCDYYGLLLNLALHVKFYKLSASSKIFIIFLVLYAFFVTYSYQGLLVGYLVSPRYNKDLDTVAQVGKSGLKIIGIASDVDEVKNSSKSHYKEFMNNLIAHPNYEVIDKKLATNDISQGFIERKKVIVFFLSLNVHNPNGVPVYHLVRECVKSFFCSYVARYDFPYRKRFEALIEKYREAGMPKHWDMLSRFQYYKENDKIESKSTIYENENIALTISHVMGIFYCWIIGLGLSIIVFVAEVLLGCNYSQR